MLRWWILLCLALLLINSATGFVHKLRLGRLPGDMRWRVLGREVGVPWVSCMLLAMALLALIKLLGWLAGLETLGF